jgi:hypothetical protein
MSRSDSGFVSASDERDVDVIPETLPPGSSLPEGSIVPETFITESIIQESYQEYKSLHFPNSPIEDSGTIIPEMLGTRLFTDEEVAHIV